MNKVKRRQDFGLAAPVNGMDQIGSGGLRATGGRVQEEFLRTLQGDRGRKVYREMADNDPTVGTMLFLLESLFKSIEWTVVPDVYFDQQPTPDHEEAAKWVSGMLFEDMDQSFDELIIDICTQFVYGWANFELIFKKRGGLNTSNKKLKSKFTDNKFGLRKLMLLGQDTLDSWEWDEDGDLLSMLQLPFMTVDKKSSRLIRIPVSKSALFRPKTYKNNPEGRSILRNCYRPWFFLKTIQESEAIGVERDLNGLPVIYIPGEWMRSDDATVQQVVQTYAKIVRDLKLNSQGGVVLPSETFPTATGDPSNVQQVRLELLSCQGTRMVDTKSLKNDYKMDILATGLMEFILLGFAEKGAYSTSKSKSDIFFRAFRGHCNQICNVFNRQVFPKIWSINGFPFENMVRLQYGDVMPRDLEQLGSFIEKLTRAGMMMFPDSELENVLRMEASLPERSPELEDEIEMQRRVRENQLNVPEEDEVDDIDIEEEEEEQ